RPFDRRGQERAQERQEAGLSPVAPAAPESRPVEIGIERREPSWTIAPTARRREVACSDQLQRSRRRTGHKTRFERASIETDVRHRLRPRVTKRNRIRTRHQRVDNCGERLLESIGWLAIL